MSRHDSDALDGQTGGHAPDSSGSGSAGLKSRWPLFVSLGLLAGLFLLYFFHAPFQDWANEAWSVFTSDNEQRTREWVKQYGWWGPILVIVLMVVQMFLIIAPTWALMVVAVLAYGPLRGVPLCVVAVLIASTVGYWVGRSLSDVTVDKLMGKKTRNKLEDAIEKHGFAAVVLIRIAPFLSNDAISFVAGLVRMGYWRYIAATAAGITPLAILIGIFGDNWKEMKMPLIVFSAIALLGYGAYIVYERGRAGRAAGKMDRV